MVSPRESLLKGFTGTSHQPNGCVRSNLPNGIHSTAIGFNRVGQRTAQSRCLHESMFPETEHANPRALSLSPASLGPRIQASQQSRFSSMAYGAAQHLEIRSPAVCGDSGTTTGMPKRANTKSQCVASMPMDKCKPERSRRTPLLVTPGGNTAQSQLCDSIFYEAAARRSRSLTATPTPTSGGGTHTRTLRPSLSA